MLGELMGRWPRDGTVAILLGSLLVADVAFTFSGLELLSPVSTLVGFPLTGFLGFCCGVFGVGRVVQDITETSSPRVPPAVGIVVFLGYSWALCSGLVAVSTPIGERWAFNTLSSSISNAAALQFDPGLTDTDRARVLASRAQEWTLYFSNPLKVGYDFHLLGQSARQVGARVYPASIWRRARPVWVYYDFEPR